MAYYDDPKSNLPTDNLPEGIRDWLKSDTVAEIIPEINRRLTIPEKSFRAIPFCITWLAIKTIKPEEFTSTLADELGWPVEKVREISATIKDRILKPIMVGLRSEVGVDIDKIDIGAAKPIRVETTKPQPTAETQTLTFERPIPKPTSATPAPMPAAPKPAGPAPTLTSARQPFMLHEEKAATVPSAKAGFSFKPFAAPAPEAAKTQPPVSVRFGATFEDASPKKAASPAAPRIPVSSLVPNRAASPSPVPKTTQITPTPKPAGPAGEPKVVHYTAYKTMLPTPPEREEKLLK